MPQNWIAYDAMAILQPLMEAKAAMLALTRFPYQRSWADELQYIQLKREVAGTSRIEGAEFTEKELEAALSQTPEQLETRSQRQAAAAVATYRWIAQLSSDQPMNETLIREVHRRLVTGCDDDHCPPGQLRSRDQNITFGTPRHRGVEGGDECVEALCQLAEAVCTVFQGIRLRRDSWVSVMYAEELNSTKSSDSFQRTDRHGILGQKLADFQLFL